MSNTAKIQHGDVDFECPVVVGSEGEKGIDISKLRAETGLITIDNGFGNTCTGQSAITFLDGEKGILRYRGISIEDLAKNSSFLEVAYLLIYGNLPTQEQYSTWENKIKRHTLLKENFSQFFNAFPRDAHPMGVLASSVSALSTFYQEFLDPKNTEEVDEVIVRLMGKLPTIASYAYKTSIGQPRIYPQNSLDYCSNFLNMMFS
ncbi:MAG: citrate/2-methylcitrate synthase, partial [Bacteriovoracaceae bacterium]